MTVPSVCPFTWLLLTIRHICHSCIPLYFLSVFSLDFFLLNTWPVRISCFLMLCVKFMLLPSWFYHITKMKTNSSSTALTFSRPTASCYFDLKHTLRKYVNQKRLNTQAWFHTCMFCEHYCELFLSGYFSLLSLLLSWQNNSLKRI